MWPFSGKQKIEEPSPPTLPEGVFLSKDQASILEGIIPGFNEPGQARTLSQKIQDMKGTVNTPYQVAAAYGAIYSKVTRERQAAIAEVERVREFYLAETILNQLTEDSLAPEVTTGEILNVYSEKDDINKELQYLNEVLDFDDIIGNITPDMLAIGEYLMEVEIDGPGEGQDCDEEPKESVNEEDDGKEKEKDTEPDDDEVKTKNQKLKKGSKDKKSTTKGKKNKGVTAVKDTVEQGTVLFVVKNNGEKGYLQIDQQGRVEFKEECEYINFSLPGKKIRYDIKRELSGLTENEEIIKELPRFIRVGKSVLWHVLSKIRELELLEQLIPATKLAKLSSGTIVGVQVPTSYDIKEATAACRQIEGIINKKIGIDKGIDSITLENIMSAAGKIKCVPIFGDKGTLQKMDYKMDEPDDLLSSIEDVRQVICMSIGIPYEILFANDTGSKMEVLKRYARYLRRLKNIQRAITGGIRQVCSIHLANKGIGFTDKDVIVEFRNKITEVDTLDRLEFMDAIVGMLDSIKRFVTEMHEEDSPMKDNVNMKQFVRFLNDQLTTIGLAGVIDPEVTPEEPAEEEEEA